MKYKFLRNILSLFVFALFVVSCKDNMVPDNPFFEEEELSKVKLCVDIGQMMTLSQTRVDENLTEEEKKGSPEECKIEDIWFFQFNASGDALLCEPRYYPIDPSHDIVTKGIEVMLVPDVDSKIYVVANIHSSSWASVSNSGSLESVKKRTLPVSHNDFKVIPGNKLSASIPMEGEMAANISISHGGNATVTVPVTRMFAKLEITLDDVPETLKITDLEIQNIPSICSIGSLWDSDGNGSTRAEYPAGTEWTTNTFQAGDKDENEKYADKYVIYIPENLQGRNQNTENQADNKTATRFENSILINFHAIPIDPFTKKEYGSPRVYSFCPGENNFNDYNIRRNYIYKIRLHLYTDKYEQETPSSNCFVIRPGQRLNFLPYVRIEKGGGYKFEDYLDPSGADPDKMIDRVSIIWQTPDAIGDNSEGNLVSIDPAPAPFDAQKERARKIYVQANKIGNALIAGYNKKGDIVWSWHIWVADHDPANVSSAIIYTTYGWDQNGIYTNARVPGYAIMPCNLGALANEPTNQNLFEGEERTYKTNDLTYEHARPTFGMLYQWGRKDPFPPLRGGNVSNYYKKRYVISLRNNSNIDDNKIITENDNPLSMDYVFQNTLSSSIKGQDIKKYTINNPTHFIVAAKAAGIGDRNVGNVVNDYDGNNGDWLYEHDNKLWGGLDPGLSNKSYVIPGTNGRFHMYDNYGSEKTIFDPCPSGWRVPPGDLWLGFSKTGLNPGNWDMINCKRSTNVGMYMFLRAWREGPESYFPAQGLRVGNGGIMRSYSCGNYHNATTDMNDQVNILHIHNAAGTFKIFEYAYDMYTRKSVGGPVRCVRDHK